jgi:hypothetical protein
LAGQHQPASGGFVDFVDLRVTEPPNPCRASSLLADYGDLERCRLLAQLVRASPAEARLTAVLTGG